MMTQKVVVLPRWRVCHRGKAYGPGETVALPVLQAVEWVSWGSVMAIGGWKESDDE